MHTVQRVVFGDSRNMRELKDDSVQLVVTSPPYYNAPFDYPDFFHGYDEFRRLVDDCASELYRVVAPGRVVCLVVDDMLVKGEKFPVVADVTTAMIKAGFRYRDRIVWVKPKGYIRISRRSGVVIQHPYPMYYYPDNIQESILIFQKGKFDYANLRKIPQTDFEKSRIPLKEYHENDWYLSVWNITNVLPFHDRSENGIAAFPDEIPRRLIRLFSCVGETVLDPFLGSGTTLKVAAELGRNGWGFEIDHRLRRVIKKKLLSNNIQHVKTNFMDRKIVRSAKMRRRKVRALSS